MNAIDNNDFNWEELVDQIDKHKVIPVIGQGLYRVLTEVTEEKKEVLLYDYLSDKLAHQMDIKSSEKKKHNFSKLAFRYLGEKSDGYRSLNQFLTKNFNKLLPVPDGPLWKLAQIRPFSLIINTTYDPYLEGVLNIVRGNSTEMLHHTYNEKKIMEVKGEKLEIIYNTGGSLVLNIYGSARYNLTPAYTENAILETVVEFQRDMVKESGNSLFQALGEKSLLFVGCRYSDWLYRFFIRTIAGKPYNVPSDSRKYNFLSDDFDSFDSGELVCFLKANNSRVFYPGKSRDFLDTLLKKLEEHNNKNVIQKKEFASTAFLSFHGANREAARQLASNLKADGINVWLDELELRPGDSVAETIVKAIEKCPAFIPLISEEAKQFLHDQNIPKYHIREWEWAFSRYVIHKNPKIIIPVKIDNTDLRYETFRDIAFIKIPGGKHEEDYEKLKKRLLKIRENNTREP